MFKLYLSSCCIISQIFTEMASHGDDMVSLHYVPWLYLKKDNLQMDIEVTHRMVNYWTNFIRLR